MSPLDGNRRTGLGSSLLVLVLNQRLGCHTRVSRVQVEEIPGELDQLDLEIDDVMILDTHSQVNALHFPIDFLSWASKHLTRGKTLLFSDVSFDLPRSVQLFVWIGKDANETEKKGAARIGELNATLFFFSRKRQRRSQTLCLSTRQPRSI